MTDLTGVLFLPNHTLWADDSDDWKTMSYLIIFTKQKKYESYN